MIKNTNLKSTVNKIGYAAVLSRPIFSDPKNFFKVDALTTFVDVNITNQLFYSDLSNSNNRLHNRMKFLSEPVINIINIFEESFDIKDRFFNIPVRYIRHGEWVYKIPNTLNREYWEEKTDENKPPVFHVKVYNLTFEEFFDLESIYYMVKEDPNNTIFFFDTLLWTKVVHYFNMSGITISGGSSNQRHLFNSLDYSLSILLTTLFGKNFVQKSTNFMHYKKKVKDIYNPKFNYNSKYAAIFREFNSLLADDKIQSFAIISKSVFSTNVKLPVKILPWDLIKIWFRIIRENSNKEDTLLNILKEIFSELKNNKSDEEIISYVTEKYGIITSGLDDFIYTEFSRLQTGKEDEMTRDDFFWKRYHFSSEDKYSYNERISIKNPNIFQKRYFHSSSNKLNEMNNKYNLKSITPPSPHPATQQLSLDKIKLSIYMNNVKDILDDTNIDSKNKQLKLEKHLFEFFDNIFVNNKNKRKDGTLDLKHKLFIDYNERLNIIHSNKTLERKFGKLSLLLNDIKWLYLTSSILTISNNKGYNSTCINVAENILFNIFLDLKQIDLNSNNYSKYLKNQFKSKAISKKKKLTKVHEVIDLFEIENIEKWQNMNYEEWIEELEIKFKFILSLGDLFITFFTDELANEIPIFIRTPRENNYNDPYIIKLNPNLDSKVISEFLDIPSNTLPMLHKPDEWKDGQIGGFLSKNFKNSSLITYPKKGSNSHKVSNLNKAYEVVNKLNAIKFQINVSLLNYLENEGQWLLDEIKINSSRDEWVYIQLTLQLAKAFSGHPFYFSHYLDWRGRVYNSSFFINYQGNDLSSSLLIFNEGQKLTEIGKYYLYIALANSHNELNVSKLSFWERYNWVTLNYNKIINLDKEFILKAEKPFNFISLALSLREYNFNPNFVIKNPIFLDATCSGIQHVAALIRDFELASLTNLNISNDNDSPKDFYTDVINKVNKEINDFGKNNLEYSNLRDVALNRRIAKQSIMTVVYNVSVYGMKEQLSNKTKIEISTNKTIDNILEQRIKSTFKNLSENFVINKNKKFILYEFPSCNENETVLLNVKDVFMISKILNKFIFSEYEGLGRVYFFITELAKITNMLNLPIIWKAPNGLEFTQYYHKYEKSQVKLRLFGVVKEIHHLTYSKDLNINKQKNAIIPNVIHTLDAAHVYSIILDSDKSMVKNVISIHDCFGTHPNNMGEIHHIVRKTFILQYTNYDFLKEFRDKIIELIKINDYEIIEENNQTILLYKNTKYVIPNTPELGEFDINQIERSTYIIC